MEVVLYRVVCRIFSGNYSIVLSLCMLGHRLSIDLSKRPFTLPSYGNGREVKTSVSNQYQTNTNTNIIVINVQRYQLRQNVVAADHSFATDYREESMGNHTLDIL